MRRTILFAGVIVALIVGAAGGYFLRWGTEPTKTVTRTVTNTVTETVPPPAAATGRVDVQVAFDGSTCSYTGPAEVKAGTTVDFTYTATVGGALVLWLVTPVTTWADVQPTTDINSPPVDFAGTWFSTRPHGAEHSTLSKKIPEGLWVVSCTTGPEAKVPNMWHATMLRVTAS